MTDQLTPNATLDDLERLIAEAYQVVASLADECGRLDDPGVIKVLDNLAAQRIVHDDVLPFL